MCIRRRRRIRATEGVVANRIPPRLAIREHAPVELPHVILLLDDRGKTVIEPFYKKRNELEKLYDFDLNMNGGHLTGWRLDAADVIAKLEEHAERVKGLYGVDTDFVFAVGDGNHSLATAQGALEEGAQGAYSGGARESSRALCAGRDRESALRRHSVRADTPLRVRSGRRGLRALYVHGTAGREQAQNVHHQHGVHDCGSTPTVRKPSRKCRTP